MHIYSTRLEEGEDLHAALVEICQREGIAAGVVLSAVGSLNGAALRLAGARQALSLTGEFEILTVTGTLSVNGSHLHVAVSDSAGRTYGGHLLPGCMIRTTCEIVVLHSFGVTFQREWDDSTGFSELKIQNS